MNKLLILIFLFVGVTSFAQDTILLLNGKKLAVRNIELRDNKIFYQRADASVKTDVTENKKKKLDAYSAFSVQYANGKERVIYAKDSLDANDFSIEEMRMFIKGEQEAMMYYHNTVNKVASAAVGVGSSLLNVYGLLLPAAYATFIAGTTPDINKHKVSAPALRDNLAFREGYESKSRNNKIKNSLMYGFGGFVVGFAAFSLLLPDPDK